MNNSGHKFEYKLKGIQPKQITEDDQEEPQSQNIAYQWYQEDEQTNHGRYYTKLYVKIPRKSLNHDARDTKRRKDEEQTMTKKKKNK